MTRTGRPRAFDEADVLEKAQEAFMLHGQEGLSFDNLAKHMGLAKPSVYRAFGNKTKLYLDLLRAYSEEIQNEVHESFSGKGGLHQAAEETLLKAVESYTSPSKGVGCLIIATSLTGVQSSSEQSKIVKDFFLKLANEFQTILENEYISDLGPHQTPSGVAAVLLSLMDTLAVQSRIGVPSEQLQINAKILSDTVFKKS